MDLRITATLLRRPRQRRQRHIGRCCCSCWSCDYDGLRCYCNDRLAIVVVAAALAASSSPPARTNASCIIIKHGINIIIVIHNLVTKAAATSATASASASSSRSSTSPNTYHNLLRRTHHSDMCGSNTQRGLPLPSPFFVRYCMVAGTRLDTGLPVALLACQRNGGHVRVTGRSGSVLPGHSFAGAGNAQLSFEVPPLVLLFVTERSPS